MFFILLFCCISSQKQSPPLQMSLRLLVASLTTAVFACLPAATPESSTIALAVFLPAVVRLGRLLITIAPPIAPTFRAAAIYEMAFAIIFWVVAVCTQLLVTATTRLRSITKTAAILQRNLFYSLRPLVSLRLLSLSHTSCSSTLLSKCREVGLLLAFLLTNSPLTSWLPPAIRVHTRVHLGIGGEWLGLAILD